MSDQMARIEGALGRIEQKIDGHMEQDRVMFASQHETNHDMYDKLAIQDQFRSRVKGVAKGATMMTGLMAAVVGMWAKAKGVW